jgi:pimeloyl-ACP methyl ester carboxylesterase
MFRHRRAPALILALLVATVFPPLAVAQSKAPAVGYSDKVKVSAATRLDWTFVLTNRSAAEVPPDWLPDYESTSQQFELFVPARRDPKQPLPAMLFISPGNQPAGWKSFENACKQLGFVFIGVRNAGNETPGKKRVRIVLDTLDEVRRLLPLDPDRTYVAGISGGGRIACAVGFALPELFGGVMPICAAGDLRDESWLRQRVIDRLSVACLTGDSDFNRGEVERLRGPMLKDVGVRTRVWVQPKLGHAMPNDRTIQEALRWLEEGLPKRREQAKRYPAARIAADAAPSREEAAAALFAEAKKRLGEKETLYSGLMQMKGCMDRWPDLDTGKEARKLLLEYEDKTEKPWEADDIAEQRRFLIARARAIDAYATGELPEQYIKQRPDMLKAAIELWKQVLADGPDTPAGREAKKRLPELEKLAKSADK